MHLLVKGEGPSGVKWKQRTENKSFPSGHLNLVMQSDDARLSVLIPAKQAHMLEYIFLRRDLLILYFWKRLEMKFNTRLEA